MVSVVVFIIIELFCLTILWYYIDFTDFSPYIDVKKKLPTISSVVCV